jgi:CheY-like chemotaxis protein
MSTSVGKKVMLVEDDPTMIAVLSTLLEIEGYQVSTPGNKALDEIVQAIRKECPDMVLLDVHIRDVSGYDVIQQVREDPSLNGTRIVMTSGMDVKERCLEAGADAFLLKPYMPDELMAKLKG